MLERICTKNGKTWTKGEKCCLYIIILFLFFLQNQKNTSYATGSMRQGKMFLLGNITINPQKITNCTIINHNIQQRKTMFCFDFRVTEKSNLKKHTFIHTRPLWSRGTAVLTDLQSHFYRLLENNFIESFGYLKQYILSLTYSHSSTILFYLLISFQRMFQVWILSMSNIQMQKQALLTCSAGQEHSQAK